MLDELKANYGSMNGSKSTKKVKPRCSMPNLIKKKVPKPVYERKKINTGGIKLDHLTFGTLRRYQYYFGLEKKHPFSDDREKILEIVEEHFANELRVNPTNVIYQFLSTKKDPDQG